MAFSFDSYPFTDIPRTRAVDFRQLKFGHRVRPDAARGGLYGSPRSDLSGQTPIAISQPSSRGILYSGLASFFRCKVQRCKVSTETESTISPVFHCLGTAVCEHTLGNKGRKFRDGFCLQFFQASWAKNYDLLRVIAVHGTMTIKFYVKF